MRRIRLGDEVLIDWSIRDKAVAGSPLTDPEDGVTISIFGPDGDPVVEDQAMTMVDTGHFRYLWQSDPDEHDEGVYATEIVAAGAGRTSRSLREPAFELVEPA